MSSNNKYANVMLMRESTVLQHAFATQGDNYNTGTTSTVLLLNAGEHIYAKWRLGSLHPYLYNHLAGFLIQKTY